MLLKQFFHSQPPTFFIKKFQYMETHLYDHTTQPVLTQVIKNATSWIGRLDSDPIDHFGGQTFICPSEGTLANIQLYTTAVQQPCVLQLFLYDFDPDANTWGNFLTGSAVELEKKDSEKWVQFNLPGLPMKKSGNYAFRLQTDTAMVGLGEAAEGTQHPFTFGHEWQADSNNEQGHYYSYFSLAFKVELRA